MTSYCKIPTFWELILYDYFTFALPFALGLHFTYLDRGELQKFNLNWDYMKNWSFFLWAFLISLVLMIVSLIVMFLYIYYLMGRLWYYLTAIFSVLIFAFLYTVYHKKTK